MGATTGADSLAGLHEWRDACAEAARTRGADLRRDGHVRQPTEISVGLEWACVVTDGSAAHETILPRDGTRQATLELVPACELECGHTT